MHLLVCAATAREIQPTINFIEQHQFENVEVLITGVGLMAATYSITRSVHKKRPRFLLQAGLAGSLDFSLSLGKTFAIESETIGDSGVEENGEFRTLADLNLSDPNKFPWLNGWLNNDINVLKESGLTAVRAVTVNEVSTNPARISYYREELGASVESLEGAALHYVALQEKIPFLQLRALSNFAGERDKNKWVMERSIEGLNVELIRLLNKMMKR